MTQPRSRSQGPPLPRWLMVLGSLAIAYHVGCVGLNVLAAPSGPWPSMEGPDMQGPPQGFAALHEQVASPYLRAIRQTHNAHFRTNRVGMPSAFLVIDLEDANGVVEQTIRFPDPKASGGLRRMQESVCRWIVDDQPLPRDITERIPAPNKKVNEVSFWEQVEGESRKLNLTRLPENELPTQQNVMRPSRWSLIVIGSLGRYFTRTQGAKTVTFARHSRDPIPPRVLMERETPPEMDELVSNYGRFPK
ncbi:MAG: hypothetical protein U0840_05180 [Gemmataceae bacterium]